MFSGGCPHSPTLAQWQAPAQGLGQCQPPGSGSVSLSPPVHGYDSGFPRPVNVSWRGDLARGKAGGPAEVEKPRKGGLESDLRVER